MSDASERGNGRASDPVPTSRFMAILNHGGMGVADIYCTKPGLESSSLPVAHISTIN